MRIYIASDHAGFEMKQLIINFLRERGGDLQMRQEAYDVQDLGPHHINPEDDYPDFILPLARRVAGEPLARGIIIGGSGQGEAMAANRIMGVRAALCYGGPQWQEIIKLSREHNDANVLSLGARFITNEEVEAMVMLWLQTPFGGDARHVRRLAKLDHS